MISRVVYLNFLAISLVSLLGRIVLTEAIVLCFQHLLNPLSAVTNSEAPLSVSCNYQVYSLLYFWPFLLFLEYFNMC